MEVLLQGCPPDMFKINEFSEGISTFSLDLPAHACEYTLKHFDAIPGISGATMKGRFDRMFPDLTFDVTDKPHNITFIFQPDPKISLELGHGAARDPATRVMASACYE